MSEEFPEDVFAGERELIESQVHPDPIVQFARWLGDAEATGIELPNAMTLATASPHARPSARNVLLRGFDARGFVFFTNYESRKASELEANPHAALVFYWKELERQVCVTGSVERATRDESAAYFASRPEGARLAAWTSRQSRPVASREELEERYQETAERFRGDEVPLPPFWGGFRLVPDTIEFWQGRTHRLHDRLRYTRQPDGAWLVERLWP